MDHTSQNGPRRGSAPGVLLTLTAIGLAAGALLAAGVLSVRAAPGGDVLDARRDRVRALEAEVQGIDARAAQAADAHAAARAQADALRARIARADADIGRTEAARAVAVQRLSDRLVALYRAEPPSLAEVLLTSGSISDAVDAQRALETVSRGDAATVESLRAARARLDRLRRGLVGDRREAQRSAEASQAQMDALQGLLGERRAALSGARAQLDGIERRRAAAADAAAARALRTRAARVPAAPAASAPVTTAPATTAPATTADPVPSPSSSIPADIATRLERIAQCESGGNPRAVSASGQYRGKYQFDQGTWEGLGGTGDPAAAPEAEQDRIAALLYARSGPAPWPVCGYR